jgi:flagellar protein FliL
MSNKLVFILIGVVLLVVLGLGGGFFMMWSKMSTMNAQGPAVPNAQAAEAPAGQTLLGPIFSLNTFIVNLADKGGNRYLRVTMDLEMTNTELTDELKERLPQVRDTVLTILPNKRFDDISTVEGKTSLRTELIEGLNSFLAQGKITKIYFKEFVVQ